MREDDLSILVVDGNRLRARVIEDALHEAGYARVVVVHEITGLVRRIEEIAPDVIDNAGAAQPRKFMSKMLPNSRARRTGIFWGFEQVT